MKQKISMDKPYTNSCEKIDWQLINNFNDHTGFFTELHRKQIHEGTYLDVYALRVKNNITKRYNVELKSRDMPHDQYTSYFLECDKYAELRRTSDDGSIPLYINFFTDGYTAIWNVDPAKGGINVNSPKKTRSVDESTGLQEKTCKYYLPIAKAVIYNSTYTRIQ